MFGKSVAEYIRFERWILALILAVGVARLGLSLAGTPNAQIKWVSVTVALLVGQIYLSIAVHTSGFGSYKQLFALLLIQSGVGETFVALAIVLGILTGTDNIFTAPEYSGGGDGKNWLHVFAHVVAAWVVLPLVTWLVGSVILFVTKKVAPRP